jgi:hypothetical protein
MGRFPVARLSWLPAFVLFLAILPAVSAGYKVKSWTPRAIETYASKLTSEGVTIAVDPLFTNALAAQAFDRTDVVTRGILPLAIIISNSNDFSVDVDGTAVELLQNDLHLKTFNPLQTVQCLFEARKSLPLKIMIPVPIPDIKITMSQPGACQDFSRKFLGMKRVAAHSTAGGFLYMPAYDAANIRKNLSSARVYIPDIYRGDSGAEMFFFEIELQAAIEAAPRK